MRPSLALAMGIGRDWEAPPESKEMQFELAKKKKNGSPRGDAGRHARRKAGPADSGEAGGPAAHNHNKKVRPQWSPVRRLTSG